MSVVFSGTNQGRFVSTGGSKLLNLRSDIDWIYVRNETVAHAAGNDTGAEFYWQKGMTQGRGLVYTKTDTTNALQVGQIAANSGFFLADTTANVPGSSVALTAISNAATPVVSTGDTSGIVEGDIVRIFNTTGAQQLGGLDFTVGTVNDNTNFELAYMAQIAAATDGTFRRIPYNPYFYPRNRTITNITQAQQAVVTLSVTHEYTVGQVIRFVIPEVTAARYGMTELDGVQATIVAVSAANNTITVDVDTTGFTSFAFPLTADPAFTPAQVVPVGADTAEGLSLNANILADATRNTGVLGVKLMAGASSPAGVDDDVIYWVAGKSFSVDNN